MPLSRRIARFNRLATNRLMLPLIARLPGFGVVRHAGRRSGRVYRTPVCAFRTPGGIAMALTYGPGTDWVRNVIAAGGCELETRGGVLRLRQPRLAAGDVGRRCVPPLIGMVLRLARVSDFLLLSR